MINPNKKSQISSQIFIYIMAIIVVGGIIGYGYYAINSLKNRAEQLAFIEFKNRLESMVRSSSNYGNVKIQDFLLPGQANKVCFIDTNYDPKSPVLLSICDPISADFNPIICNSWYSKSDSNVFLEPYLNSISIQKMSVDGNRNKKDDRQEQCNDKTCHFICLRSFAGKIKIRLEGKGTHTLVGEP